VQAKFFAIVDCLGTISEAVELPPVALGRSPSSGGSGVPFPIVPSVRGWRDRSGPASLSKNHQEWFTDT